MQDTKKIQIVKVNFGKNVQIIEPVNLYECEIGDDCFIGPFVEIQSNVVSGKKNRIQSHSFYLTQASKLLTIVLLDTE